MAEKFVVAKQRYSAFKAKASQVEWRQHSSVLLAEVVASLFLCNLLAIILLSIVYTELDSILYSSELDYTSHPHLPALLATEVGFVVGFAIKGRWRLGPFTLAALAGISAFWVATTGWLVVPAIVVSVIALIFVTRTLLDQYSAD